MFLDILHRSSSLLLATLSICALFLAIACGGGGDSDSGFTGARTRLQEVVPEAIEFSGDVIVHEGSEDEVNLVISSQLANSPRFHVISDDDAIKDGEFLEEVDGTKFYLTRATYWADISGSTPLFVGSSDRVSVEAYVSFYEDGEPQFSDERFWVVYDYARDRFADELGKDPAGIRVNYKQDWREGYDGIRLQASIGEEQVYLAVLLHSLDSGLGVDDFDEATLDDFALRFAVLDESEEVDDLPDWGFAALAWSGSGSGSGG